MVLSGFPDLQDVLALIPNLDFPCSVLAFRDLAFPAIVAERMVFNLYREALDSRFDRDSARNGPAL